MIPKISNTDKDFLINIPYSDKKQILSTYEIIKNHRLLTSWHEFSYLLYDKTRTKKTSFASNGRVYETIDRKK